MTAAAMTRLDGHDGFTTLELLAVSGILAIITAIGLPYYGSYRTGTVDAAMGAAVRNARLAIESLSIENGTYEDATVADLESHGFRSISDVTLVIEAATADAYVLRACGEGGSTA